jgi:pseudouridylate synthase
MDASQLMIKPEVAEALHAGRPVVALESTVISHGLPYPQNLALAQQMEAEVARGGALAATVAVLDGQICIGLTSSQLERLAQPQGVHKISSRDLAPAQVMKWNGGTTVAGTMAAAQPAGIRVFATGGIGGVHRDAPFDVSADLPQLAQCPMIVVCAGAKAILDLPATLEYLETVAVPVVGYRCDEFPAFYSPSSGLSVSVRADTPEMIADIARAHWALGLRSAILVGNPPPSATALPNEAVDGAILQAMIELKAQGIHGQAVTPFLLARVSELTGGASLEANLGLLLNNARLAAQIAVSDARHR